jgi:hypothetical protein
MNHVFNYYIETLETLPKIRFKNQEKFKIYMIS